MKTFSKYLSLFFLVSLVNSCTLSFDEWITPEEKKGFDEVITEESDFGRVSYQYADNTKHITDNVLEYVASVESDSIIYFMESTPSEWLPKKGNCLAAGVSELFPLGLCRRVTEVERANGFYKVTTTKATLDEVYEYYNVKLSCDVNPDFSAVQEVVVNTDSGEVKQLRAYDYSFLDSKTRRRMAKTKLPVTTESRIRTRADGDTIINNVTGYAFDTRWSFPDSYIEYYTKKKICVDAEGFNNFKWVEALRNSVNTKLESVTKTAAFKEAVQKIAGALDLPNVGSYKIIPFATSEYISSKTSKIDVEIDSKSGYKKVVQEDFGKNELRIEIGVEVKTDGPLEQKTKIDKLKSRISVWILNQLEKTRGEIDSDVYSKSNPEFTLTIPLSPPFVTLEVKLTFDIAIDITMSGSLTWTELEARQRKEMVKSDEKSDFVESKPVTLEKARTLSPYFNAQGTASFKVSTSFQVLFIFGEVLGVGVGATVEGGIEISVQSADYFMGDGFRIESHSNDKNYIKPFLTITPILVGYVAGWKPSLEISNFQVTLEKPIPFYPVVRDVNSHGFEVDATHFKANTEVSFKDKGLIFGDKADIVYIFYNQRPAVGDENKVLGMFCLKDQTLKVTTDEMAKKNESKFYSIIDVLDMRAMIVDENNPNVGPEKEIYVLIGLCDDFDDPTETIYVDVSTATKVAWEMTLVSPVSWKQIHGDDIPFYDPLCETPELADYDYARIINDFNAHHFSELVRALTIDDMAMYSVLGTFKVSGGSNIKKWGVRVVGRVGNQIKFSEKVPMNRLNSGTYSLLYKFMLNMKVDTEHYSVKNPLMVCMYPYWVTKDGMEYEDQITLPDVSMRYPIGDQFLHYIKGARNLKEYMSGQ